MPVAVRSARARSAYKADGQLPVPLPPMSAPLFLAGRDLLEFSREREQHQRARRTAHQDPPGCDPARPGPREDALAAIEEAAQVYRELAARWPDAYYQLEQSLRLTDWLQHGESDASPRESKT
jgi:hypothetical protein